jgi:very-long-chain enoyl-CoA reductase
MTTKVQLTNKSKKRGERIESLPGVIDIPKDTTVEDAKVLIARLSGVSDYNRIGLYDPVHRRVLKDRKQLIWADPNVSTACEVVVKDLGTTSPPAPAPPSPGTCGGYANTQ